MSRKNRDSVHDGIYHVTSRIANRAMLLEEDSVNDMITEWIVSVADFSGVEVWSFCVMDNHLHLFVRVPPVPERYWLAPDDEPCAYAFGMRPSECREPLWSPDGDCPPPPGEMRMATGSPMEARSPQGRVRSRAIRMRTVTTMTKRDWREPIRWSRMPDPVRPSGISTITTIDWLVRTRGLPAAHPALFCQTRAIRVSYKCADPWRRSQGDVPYDFFSDAVDWRRLIRRTAAPTSKSNPFVGSGIEPMRGSASVGRDV